MAAKRSDVVMRQRMATHQTWMKLELLVAVLEDNLPIVEEALADADLPTRGCVKRIREALEKIDDG